MIIDFNQIPTQHLDAFKGGQLYLDTKMYVDDLTRIMKGRLVPGASIGMHTHTDSSEMIYIISGTGTVMYNGSELTVKSGECHYCPKGSTHTLINKGTDDLTFFAVVPQQ